MATTLQESLHWCTPCASEAWFEVVVFDDGFGDASERACVDCGHAIVVGLAFVDAHDLELTQPLAA